MTCGSSEDEKVLQYPWKSSLIMTSLYSVIVGAILYFKSKSAIVVAFFSTLWFLVFCLGLRRRLKISKYEVAYRPPIGPTGSAKFVDVISIQKTSVAVSSCSRALVQGLILELSNATALGIPLDLPNGTEIGDQIIKAWEGQRNAQRQA